MTPDAPEVAPQVATQTPTAEAPKADAKETSPKPTLEHFSAEQIEQRVKGALEYLGKPRSERKKEEAKPEKPEDKPKQEPEKVADKADKPADKVVDKKPRKPAKSEDDVADRIEKGFDKLADKIREKPSDKDKEEPPVVEGKDAVRLKVFEAMAKENPEYATLPEKFKAFTKLEKAYKAKWEKDNPGESFDAGDDAHEDFYSKHEPKFDTDDYVDARADLRAKEQVERLHKEEQSKRQKAEQQAEAERSAKEATADVGDKLASELLGKETTLKDLASEDEFSHKFVAKAVSDANTVISEMTKLLKPGSTVQFDPVGNKLHGVIDERLRAYEQDISQLDEDAQVIVENGRRKDFATLDDFLQMSPREQANHWTIFAKPDIAKNMLLKDFAHVVKQDIAEAEQLYAKRLQKQGGQSGSKSQQAAGGNNQASTNRPSPPNMDGGDRKVPPVDPAASKSDDPISAVASYYNRR